LCPDLQSAIFFSLKQLIFNSLTNCLGPRKLLHSGKLYKTKSNKELHAFLFNDFLLLTYLVRQFAAASGHEKLFNSKSSAQFRMYKTVSANHGTWGLLACLRCHRAVAFTSSQGKEPGKHSIVPQPALISL
jgi:hypothetical protein